ncbi:MAG: hypothetical protein ACMG55_10150 [Microcoleus sp.]
MNWNVFKMRSRFERPAILFEIEDWELVKSVWFWSASLQQTSCKVENYLKIICVYLRVSATICGLCINQRFMQEV